jgi:phosphate transport system ATP-binding protein
MAAIFQLENLHLNYPSKSLFQGINLSIPDERIISIMGPSGCGKSSFLSLLNRVFELDPSIKVSGKIIFEGQNILDSKYPVSDLRKKIGMIFQTPSCFPVSIAKNIEIVLEEQGIKKKEQKQEKTKELLQKVYLWDDVKDRLNKPATKLSGGQQQRLCIARCLAREPELLLMDEPCSALDPVTSAGIEALIKDLSKEKRVILVTHNIAQAKRLATHGILFWNDGTKAFVLESGNMQEMVDKPCCETTRRYFHGELG